MYGLLGCDSDPRARLLVMDDRAYDELRTHLPDVRAGHITAFPKAVRCAELVSGDPGWKRSTATAMICQDLRDVPAVPLPCGLTLEPVRRFDRDAASGVALHEAAALAGLADPGLDGSLDSFASYLRSLPPSIRLFAAVDGEGHVRATSGSGVYGHEAIVLFVNTHPAWRRRGIARAMTAAALRAAHRSGARRACLDASDASLRIYQRLGFQAVTETNRFFRPL